ncbi:recombinase family protein [uncultured Clostridium sp.]|uniref:recombinase family protein n=1 Tax=uncultured Clostridium sp. TaxID=59620 RepID=UPI002670E206|nr:recombinase family protein [uncultured Clostridium sp.]
MKRIAIYSRKSKETDTGESIKNQINICKEYFLRQYNECIFEIFEDEGFSGGNTNRPAFKRMMQLAEHKQFDIIAAYKIDRISRNTLDFLTMFEKLKLNDIELVSVTEGFDASTPAGRMMMSMISSIAEMERANIAQRVKDNMFELAKLGRWSGGTPPTGYRSVKVIENGKSSVYLEVIDEYIPIIKNIFRLAAKGYTNYQIANKVNMSAKTINNILKNPTYMISDEQGSLFLKSIGYNIFGIENGNGYLTYNRRPRKNGKKLSRSISMIASVSLHKGIVTSNEWIESYTKVNSRFNEAKPRISQLTFLSHLVKCKCGSGMFVSPGRRRKDGTRTLYFRCSNKKNGGKCDSGFLKILDVEDALLTIFHDISLDKSLINNYIKAQNHLEYDAEINILKKSIENNNKAINSLTEKLILIEGAAINIISKKINILHFENENLNKKLFDLERKKLLSLNTYNIDLIYDSINLLLSEWDNLDITDKQLYIKKIIASITWDGADEIDINLR